MSLFIDLGLRCHMCELCSKIEEDRAKTAVSVVDEWHCGQTDTHARTHTQTPTDILSSDFCISPMPRYSPLSVEVVEKLNTCKVSWPRFFSWGTTPTVLQQIVSAIYHLPFGKVWLNSVCLPPSAKPGNEAQCRIYGGWVKCRSSFKPSVDQST